MKGKPGFVINIVDKFFDPQQQQKNGQPYGAVRSLAA